MAMAPPLTFTMSVFQAMSRLTASACAANASFASMRSRSATFQPAFSSARREAGIGPEPMMAGLTPAVDQEAMRARGGMARRRGSGGLMVENGGGAGGYA